MSIHLFRTGAIVYTLTDKKSVVRLSIIVLFPDPGARDQSIIILLFTINILSNDLREDGV